MPRPCAPTLPCMAGCCPSRDYHRFFNQRFARRLANRDRKRGLDTTAQKMVEFLRELGIQGASVLKIGGGVGEIQIDLLKLGAARAQHLELSPAYEQQARTLAGQARGPRAPGLAYPRPRRGPGGGGAGRPGGPAPGGVLLPRLPAPACSCRRPYAARPGLQLSTPETCCPAPSMGCSTW
jgi:hypothetical protein